MSESFASKNESMKKKYKFLHLLDDGRIILGDLAGYESTSRCYDFILHRELAKKWELLERDIPVKEKMKKFTLGGHVLAYSVSCQGARRGVIQGIKKGPGERIYLVYLYDEGVVEDVPQSFVRVLDQEMKDLIEPRTVMIRLTRITLDIKPASKVPVGVPNESTTDFAWSYKIKFMITKWLTEAIVNHLGITSSQANPDGSISGCVYRKLHVGAVVEAEVDEKGDKPKKKRWFLHKYIQSLNLPIPTKSQQPAPVTNMLSEVDLARTRVNLTTDSPKPVKEPRPVKINKISDSATQTNRKVKQQELFSHSTSTGCNVEKASRTVKEDQIGKRQVAIDKIDLEESRVHINRDPPVPRKTSLKSIRKVPCNPSYAAISSKSIMVNLATDSYERNKLNIPGHLLVRGKWARPPYANIEEFLLPKPIQKAMETMGVKVLSDVHKITAPNFKRGNDVMVITPDSGIQRGKEIRALSYLLPIISLVFEQYSNITTVDSTQPPETLIIVNSYNTGKGLETYITAGLLIYAQGVPIRVKFLVRDVNATKLPSYEHKLIPGGITILIMTMSYMKLVLQTRGGSLLFQKLRFLIFEEVDQYLSSYWDSIEGFIEALGINQYVSSQSVPFQITFSGSKWVSDIEKLYKLMVNDQNRAPLVIMSSPSQVVRYSKINWKVHHILGEDQRLKALVNLIQSSSVSTHNRIAIICSTPEVAENVHESIKALGGGLETHLIAGHNTSLQIDLIDIHSRWKTRSRSNLLILSDEMLHLVKISNATCLICYDSPTKSSDRVLGRRVNTAERFALLWDNIRGIEVDPDTEGSLPSSSCSTRSSAPSSEDLIAHFLLSGNESNFYEIYKFASTLDTKVDFAPALHHRAQEIEREGLRDAPLCTGIQLFGFCNNTSPGTCPARHTFSRKELSTPAATPYSGELELQIVKCLNPSFYQVKLLKHYNFADRKRYFGRSFISEAKRRRMQLMKYYSVAENSVQLKSFDRGTWCAVKITDPDTDNHNFERGTVERINQHNKYAEPTSIRVYCVDTGYTVNPSVDQVVRLPKNFQDPAWRPLVVNLVLCNLKPINGENEYRTTLVDKARHLLDGKKLTAKIWLSIGNTVWVNPMVEYHINQETGKLYKGKSMRLQLIEDKAADFNQYHLEVLMELVNKFPKEYPGITSMYGKMSKFSKELDLAKNLFYQSGNETQWAFVEKSRDTKFVQEKIVSMFGQGPWQFFGVHDKFYGQLKSLEKELHQVVEAYINGTGEETWFTRYTEMFQNYYESGLVVAAREREEKVWMRGLIIGEYHDEIQHVPVYSVFFVDYGDVCDDMTWEELFPIPNNLVTRLPFQAIAFRLDHIVPMDGSERWNDDSINAFLDIIVKNNVSIDMGVVAYEDVKNVEETNIPFRYYKAAVFYKRQEIGATLVENGMAKWAPGQEHFAQEMTNRLFDFYNANNASASATPTVQEVAENDQVEYTHLSPLETHLSTSAYDCYLNAETMGNMFKPAKPNGANVPVIESVPDTGMHPVASTSIASAGVAAPLKTDLLSPPLIWRQTENHFIITIQLPDINMFELTILPDKNTIDFKTVDKTPNYGFRIKLFGKVEPEYKTHLTGMRLKVTFSKRMSNVKWPRALFDKKERFRWLKEDMNELQLSDEEEEEKTVNLKDYDYLSLTKSRVHPDYMDMDDSFKELEYEVGEMIDNDAYDSDDYDY